MKFRINKKYIAWGITAFLVIASSILFYFFLFHGGSFLAGLSRITHTLMAVVYGVVLGYILTPVLNFIEQKILRPMFKKAGANVDDVHNRKWWNIMRKISILLTMAFFLIILVGTIMIIVPQLIASIQSIAVSLPTYVTNVTNFINDKLSNVNEEAGNTVTQFINSAYVQIEAFINNRILPNITSIIQSVSRNTWNVIRMLLNFFIGIIVSVYVLNSKESFCAQGKKLAYAFFKESIANEVVGEFRFIHHTFTGFFIGKIIDSLLIGIICFIGTSIIGTPYPVLMSFIVGVTNIVPIFGPYVGAIIGSILVFMIDPLQSLIFLIFVFILQQFDGNILGPMILGSSTGLSSFWVIFSILLFGGIFGIGGWIIGVPLFATFYSILSRITNHFLRSKGLSTNTNEYINTAYVEEGRSILMHEAKEGKYNTRQPGSALKMIFGHRITKWISSKFHSKK